MVRTNIQIGNIAESYVYYWLTKANCIVSFPPQGAVYDFIADDGVGLYTVQVKSTAQVLKANHYTYRFSVGKGKSKKDNYLQDNVDILALFSLAEERVLFMKPDTKTTMHVHEKNFSKENELLSWGDTRSQSVCRKVFS